MSGDLAYERQILRQLEQIRRCAWEEGAYATPSLDRAIDDTREVIALLEQASGRPVDAQEKVST